MKSSADRCLIVNADDFGLTAEVNRGIMRAHEEGIVTSASLMVRAEAAAEAARYANRHRDLSPGLHVDLGEWSCGSGSWRPVYQVVDLEDGSAVRAEVNRQLADFIDLVGRAPSHIDSHQHVHLREPVRAILIQVAAQVGVPLRQVSGDVHYCGDFYGQMADGTPLPEAISVHGLLQILRSLPEGATELACHPGTGSDLSTMYTFEREIELAALCDRRVREAIVAMEIELCSFDGIARRRPGVER